MGTFLFFPRRVKGKNGNVPIFLQLGLLGLALSLAGCQARAYHTYAFPTTWPGSLPIASDAPLVLVRPMALKMPAEPVVPDAQEGLPTAAVLSVLLIKHLQVNGVNALLESPEASATRYALSCEVPVLGYEETGKGYPKTYRYRAELLCALTEPPGEQVVWRRELAQQYDDSRLFDFMTKLPPEPHKHDRVLYRECIVPLWDAMASSVGALVRSRMSAPASAQGPAETTP